MSLNLLLFWFTFFFSSEIGCGPGLQCVGIIFFFFQCFIKGICVPFCRAEFLKRQYSLFNLHPQQLCGALYLLFRSSQFFCNITSAVHLPIFICTF